MTKTVAYLGIPHTGGTFTVFLALRQALKCKGFDVRWVGVGRQSFEYACQSAYEEFSAMGEVVGRDATTPLAQLGALKAHLESGRYSTVFVNTACGLVETNIARYLNPKIHRLQIVHTITPGTYEYARIIEPWTHGTICVSARAAKDLIEGFGFPPKKVFTIPTAVDTAALCSAAELVRCDPADTNIKNALRILFLGRIENASKGVFLLPRIAQGISDLPFRLTIAGDGPDLTQLMSRFAGFGTQVAFAGLVPHTQVGDILACHDVLIFPSNYEGLGLSLLEAMACGCVPVASRISGVTDTVVDDGINGILFPIGDARAAARALRSLWEDRTMLDTLARRTREKARESFSIARMAACYTEAMRKTQTSATTLEKPIDSDRWDFPERLTSRLRQKLPDWLKQGLRTYREVLRASTSEAA